jgi:hypothetical protein
VLVKGRGWRQWIPSEEIKGGKGKEVIAKMNVLCSEIIYCNVKCKRM